ncbi:MAG: class I SAM-dependent methyltransferase [Planctomycetota bacterium]|jgi:ubiquinone/menaquinone biosynthesis C-methylase UbiE
MLHAGVFPWEEEIIRQTGIQEDEYILLLFAGGGRDAIGLAKLGHSVTAVEFVPSLLEMGKKNAETAGVKVEYHLQESSKIEFSDESFQAVVAFLHMYSAIPGRKNRVSMLERIKKALKPGGAAILSFNLIPLRPNEIRLHRWLKPIAKTIGNGEYQLGDTIHNNVEFAHYFQSEDEARQEALDAGFTDVRVDKKPGGPYLILRKEGV